MRSVLALLCVGPLLVTVFCIALGRCGAAQCWAGPLRSEGPGPFFQRSGISSRELSWAVDALSTVPAG